MNNPQAQLPLDIRLPEDGCFERFVAGGNEQLLTLLRDFPVAGSAAHPLLLWGARGCGKTHLLQAACRDVAAAGSRYVYLPLDGSLSLAPEVLQDLGHLPLVVLDDLDRRVPDAAWSEALFRLFNEVQDAGGRLLLSARQPPRGLVTPLADLATRLARCLVVEVSPLGGEDALLLFRRRAEERGLQVGDEVAGYLMRRGPRETGALLGLLDQLDRAALAAQRRLTVPFIKETLGW